LLPTQSVDMAWDVFGNGVNTSTLPQVAKSPTSLDGDVGLSSQSESSGSDKGLLATKRTANIEKIFLAEHEHQLTALELRNILAFSCHAIVSARVRKKQRAACPCCGGQFFSGFLRIAFIGSQPFRLSFAGEENFGNTATKV